MRLEDGMSFGRRRTCVSRFSEIVCCAAKHVFSPNAIALVASQAASILPMLELRLRRASLWNVLLLALSVRHVTARYWR